MSDDFDVDNTSLEMGMRYGSRIVWKAVGCVIAATLFSYNVFAQEAVTLMCQYRWHAELTGPVLSERRFVITVYLPTNAYISDGREFNDGLEKWSQAFGQIFPVFKWSFCQ